MFVRPHFAGIVMRNGFRMREERKVVAVQSTDSCPSIKNLGL
jgi:hypothetical protein